MPDNLLSKIKRTMIEGVSCTAAKLEEGARFGKLKLDILAEENRLDHKYSRLGEVYFQSLQNSSSDELKSDPATIELVGAVAENHKRIHDLKDKLKAMQSSTPKACKP